MKPLSLLLAGLILTSAQQASPRQAVVVKGIVLRLGTREPVAKVVVKLSHFDGPEVLGVITGADGRFEFGDLPAGRYELLASRNGYVDSVLSVSSQPNTIELVMAPTGAVSGRVFDDSGDPVMNVVVAALKYSYSRDQRSMTLEKTAQTNDLGEFRIFGLRPGQYFVSVVPQKNGRLNRFISDGELPGFDTQESLSSTPLRSSVIQRPGEAYPQTYYPGTSDPRAAVRVEVPPGADLHGFDFALSPVKTRKIRGSLINGVTGQLAGSADVQLRPVGRIGDPLSVSTENGKFEFNGVLPGTYRIVATARPFRQVYSGHATVEVENSDSDSEEIRITINPPFQVTGNVTSDSGDLAQDLSLKGRLPPILWLFQHAQEKGMDSTLSQSPCSYPDLPKTNCIFEGVMEGDYKLLWGGLPPGSYVKSVMLNSEDALNAPIHLESKTTNSLKVVVSYTAGEVAGIVRTGQNRAAPGARVVLVPDATRRQRDDLYMTVETDEAGHYQIQGIPPGNYTLFCWEDIEDGIWRDADFLRRNEASGKYIHIGESSRESLDLIAAPFAF